jgi:hypothetical protein
VQWQLPRGKCLTARYKLTANRKCTIVDEKFSVKVKVRIAAVFLAFCPDLFGFFFDILFTRRAAMHQEQG